MSAGAIRAGKAFVELSIRDMLDKGLNLAQQKLLAWGRGLAGVGTMITAAAGAVLAAMGNAALAFADAGSEIFDLTQKTGVGAETLTALKYAADQSGASVQSVAAGFKGLAKFALAAATGNKKAIATLEGLGIPVKEFLAVTPEDRFMLVADALAQIEDPGMRAGLAMQLLGKSGVDLLPMLNEGSAGLKRMADRARELGVVMSDEQTAKADELGDAWGDVGVAFKAAHIQIGAALADAILPLLNALSTGAATIGEFVRNNQGLVVGLAATAAITGAVGLAVLALSGGLTLLAGVVAGVSALMAIYTAVTTAAAAATAFFLTPLGIAVLILGAVAAALAAGTIYFLGWTKTGQAAFSGMMQVLGAFWSIFQKTMGGVMAALMSGNWQLAGAVMMAGLAAAWQQGILVLQTMWENFKLWLVSLWENMFAGIFETLARAQAHIVETINSMRQDLGMEGNVRGFSAIDDWAKNARREANAAIAAQRKGKDERLAEATKAVATATKALDAAVALAQASRQADAVQRAKDTSGSLHQPFQKAADAVFGPGSAGGAFNAAVKGLLSRSGESAAERTANATEAIKDGIEGLRGDVQDFNEVEE
jgi:hypothetical protein